MRWRRRCGGPSSRSTPSTPPAAVPGGVDADVKFYGVTDASRMLTTLLGSLTFLTVQSNLICYYYSFMRLLAQDV